MCVLQWRRRLYVRAGDCEQVSKFKIFTFFLFLFFAHFFIMIFKPHIFYLFEESTLYQYLYLTAHLSCTINIIMCQLWMIIMMIMNLTMNMMMNNIRRGGGTVRRGRADQRGHQVLSIWSWMIMIMIMMIILTKSHQRQHQR